MGCLWRTLDRRTFPPFPPHTIAQFTTSTLCQEPLRVIAARNLTQSSPSFLINNPVGLYPKDFLKCANSFLRQSRKLAVNFSAIVLGNPENFLNSSDCFPRTAESEYGPISWSFSFKYSGRADSSISLAKPSGKSSSIIDCIARIFPKKKPSTL